MAKITIGLGLVLMVLGLSGPAEPATARRTGPPCRSLWTAPGEAIRPWLGRSAQSVDQQRYPYTVVLESEVEAQPVESFEKAGARHRCRITQ